ncbi:MAG TPA: hydroxyacid dehydrogenase [Chthoniobacteraceae bacterium]|nr:hydroxyacid dehydrogenase [Chthoniobacteraceae bacterium]
MQTEPIALRNARLFPPGQTCLLTLSEDERSLFFPDVDLENALPCRALWIDTARSRNGWESLLAGFSPSVVMTGWSTPRLPAALVGDEGSPLRYICHLTGSVRRVVPREFIERGGLVSNWGGEISHSVAEHTLLLALAALRNLPAWRPYTAQPGRTLLDRSRFLATRSLQGRRVGIHGFGSVARRLLRLLAPFEVSCEVYSAGVAPDSIHRHGAEPAGSLPALFRRSEVLFECEALTPATVNSVTREMLSLLPEGAVFINVARGALVDEAALLDLARRGRLRVGLDVLRDEPVSPSSPFWETPNVVLSPHIGGPTHDLYPRCGAFALDNIRRYLSGERPGGVVDLEVYDRTT